MRFPRKTVLADESQLGVSAVLGGINCRETIARLAKSAAASATLQFAKSGYKTKEVAVTLGTTTGLAVRLSPSSGAAGSWQEVTPVEVGKAFNNPPWTDMNYGLQVVIHDPRNPGTFYLGTCDQGVWKTTTMGDSWVRLDKQHNVYGGPMTGGPIRGRHWALAMDNHNGALYTASGYGQNGQGCFKSTDGGATWYQMIPPSLGVLLNIYHVACDPLIADHILVTFHRGDDVIESFNGGKDWTFNNGAGGNTDGHYIFFLDNSVTWLLASQGSGLWRTTNSGATWTKVSHVVAQHGAAQPYKATDGSWYFAGQDLTTWKGTIVRSTDGGATWSQVKGEQTGANGDAYYSIIGDGTRLYTRCGSLAAGKSPGLPYITALESNSSVWTNYNNQTDVSNGPGWMAYDPVNRVILSSNWGAGVWRLMIP